MKIRSINDVITNSSDEVFVFKSTLDPTRVKKELLRALGPDHDHSGMGGILEVTSTPEMAEEFSYRGAFKGLPSGYLLVTLDYGFIEDLKPWVEEHLGEPVSDRELNEMLTPRYTDDYQKAHRALSEVTEVNPRTQSILRDFTMARHQLRAIGAPIPSLPIPVTKVQLFIDHYQAKLDDLRAKAEPLDHESEEYYDLTLDMDMYRATIGSLTKLINENT